MSNQIPDSKAHVVSHYVGYPVPILEHMPFADLNDNLQGDYEITAKALTVFPVQAERSTRLTDTGARK